jgi:predicted enzyme related to lactoylglutathione lyase
VLVAIPGRPRPAEEGEMPNPVQHFEIYGDNPEKLAEFYRRVFGWNVTKAPNMDYWMLYTAATDEKGMATEPGAINGGLMKRPMPDARAWMNYVTVPSLDEAIKSLQAAGGTVLRGRTAVPKMGWFAVVADPEMNPFGIWQSDPNAG